MRRVALASLVVAGIMRTGTAHAQGVEAASADQPAVETPPPPHPGLFTHDGFYLRFAIGPGAYLLGRGTPSGETGAVDETSAGKSDSGFGASEIFALGGTLPGGVVLGGALSALVSSGATVGNYGFLIDWFPDPHGGWHVGALLGLGLVRDGSAQLTAPANTVSLPVAPRSANLGLGMSVLGGYDAWVTPQFSMGVNFMATTMAFAKQEFDGAEIPSYSLTPLVGGVMLSLLYH
jgi:hypothetical protein